MVSVTIRNAKREVPYLQGGASKQNNFTTDESPHNLPL
jgi:hypothetical protein